MVIVGRCFAVPMSSFVEFRWDVNVSADCDLPHYRGLTKLYPYGSQHVSTMREYLGGSSIVTNEQLTAHPVEYSVIR